MDLFSMSTDGKSNELDPGWSDKERLSAYVALEHFIPILPNLMVRYNDLGSSGDGTELDLSNADFIFYWQLLDNDGIELDLGVNYRQYDGALREGWENVELDKGVVMGYARSRINLVSSGLFVFADVALTNYNSKQISDYQVGLGYGLDLSLFDLNIKGGYREHDFDVRHFKGISADVTQNGWFVGAEVQF
ncbi:TIGR04219 family outer membrane beta-barrel protein [Ferrimonas gelatinilytica]|uniref:TIGR04219 family outer membrane beta-barrel protein n=1 Tax=Ferrimonas gelatinilytica TaxID=1255257 RepID=A0ABP9S5Q5_9GAMM